MEMEKINDNMIRVLLENEDLTERGITVLDLLGNQSEIESFFFSILDEVDKDHEFRNNEAVTFQLMPNRNGLELLITKSNPSQNKPIEDSIKNDDSENQDPDDFNNGTENGDVFTNELADYIRSQLEDKDKKESVIHSAGNKTVDDDGDGVSGYLNAEDESQKHFLVNFVNFENFIGLASVFPYSNVVSNLYAYDGQYFLELVFFESEMTSDQVKDALSLAYEYGDPVNFSVDVVRERGKLIMEHAAIEIARYHFNQKK